MTDSKAEQEPTVAEAEHIIRKIMLCESMGARIVLLRNFAERCANALVAAAYGACERHTDKVGREIFLSRHQWQRELREAIRSLTPEAATKELERRLAEAERKGRLGEVTTLWNQDFTEAYNGGYLNKRGRDLLRERIAALESAAAKQTSAQGPEGQ